MKAVHLVKKTLSMGRCARAVFKQEGSITLTLVIKGGRREDSHRPRLAPAARAARVGKLKAVEIVVKLLLGTAFNEN